MPNVKSIKKYWPDLLIIALLGLTLPVFFYNLGQSSLVSWDEAWYAEIGRNIIYSGNIFNLSWNSVSYIDHPPVGFWLIAIGEAVFGFNEFGARVSSAISGFATLIVLYFLGKELFSRSVGFASALALTSSFWFLFRARSGNLDVFLTMFFVLTIFLAIKASKNVKYLIPFSISAALLFLTKSIIPLTIIPTLAVIFWRSKAAKEDFKKPLTIFLSIVGVWAIFQRIVNPDYLKRYFNVGLPGVEVKTSYLDNFLLTKTYLHDGIGKWFWPGILGVGGGLITFQKRFYILSSLCIFMFLPFISSAKGHIWHLIPIHPFMILAFFGFSFWLFQEFLRLLISLLRLKKPGLLKYLPAAAIILFSLYISFFQLKQSFYQFIDIPRYVSDEQILSMLASRYPDPLLIDGDFGPAAVFYSGKQVRRITNDQFSGLFDQNDQNYHKNFLLITQQYRLDHFKIPKSSYQILRTDRDKILIRKV